MDFVDTVKMSFLGYIPLTMAAARGLKLVKLSHSFRGPLKNNTVLIKGI